MAHAPINFAHSMSAHGTHLLSLVRMCVATDGPILELGCGWNSTPILNAFAKSGRLVVSLDTKQEWLDPFSHLDGPSHQVRHVADWSEATDIITAHRWSVALLDLAPACTRAAVLETLRHHANLIICHDTQADARPAYHWDPILSTFPFLAEDRRISPYTTVVSDVMPIPELW